MYTFSCVPWVTSSLVSGVKIHHFQCVTREFLLINRGSRDILVGFTENAFNSSHYMTCPSSSSIDLTVRIADLYLSSSTSTAYDLFAGLTLIDRREMPVLTGTLSNGSAGWDGVG